MKSIVLFLIKTHYFLRSIGIPVRGLGKFQKLLRKEFIFESFGNKFYYDPTVIGSYDYLLIGKSNEPETQLFLNNLLPKLESANFIDVGASIGEFVNSVSRHKNVKSIFAFEPRPDAAAVLRKNIVLNDDNRITIIENAVSNEIAKITIHLNAGGTSSGFYSTSTIGNQNSIQVSTVMIDSVLPVLLPNSILLIDVEGAEPLVLKGSTSFIKKNNPLIIFEYNLVSKEHFQIDQIEEILGNGYSIYRLRGDGKLDKDFSNSWNCVAIPTESLFKSILASQIIQPN